MARTMYDAVTLSNVPSTAQMVGCYIDGHYKNDAEARRRFPHARIVTITVLGTPGANVVDCEPGDCTPASAAVWAAHEVAGGRKPTIYCSLSWWDEVKAAVASQRITGKVSYWIAHYNGIAAIPNGAVAVQFLGDYHGYDQSTVGSYWPGVDPIIRRLIPAPRKPNVPKPTPKHNPFPSPSRSLLFLGAKGNDVKWIQWALGVTTDGDFGPKTEMAVRAFQKFHGLVVDGKVGPQTKAKLALVTH